LCACVRACVRACAWIRVRLPSRLPLRLRLHGPACPPHHRRLLCSYPCLLGTPPSIKPLPPDSPSLAPSCVCVCVCVCVCTGRADCLSPRLCPPRRALDSFQAILTKTISVQSTSSKVRVWSGNRKDRVCTTRTKHARFDGYVGYEGGGLGPTHALCMSLGGGLL
jgi:hypothetical protein